MKTDKNGSGETETWNDWYARKVSASIAAVERGEIVSDDEVRAWLEARERLAAERAERRSF